MPMSAEVSLPNDTQIQVVRDFAAPRPLVFRAFTRPELIRRWLLGPPGWSMPACTVDLRPGGKYHYRWRNDTDGREFGLNGVYQSIVPDDRLEIRESFEDVGPAGEAHIDTRFTDDGQATRVTYVITAESRKERDAALATGMTDGMEMSFKGLDAMLAASANGGG